MRPIWVYHTDYHGNDQNIDLIYDQRASLFKVIYGEQITGIGFMIDSLKLYKVWTKLNLAFDLDNNLVECSINGKTVGKSSLKLKSSCFKFLWGANVFSAIQDQGLTPDAAEKYKNIRTAKVEIFLATGRNSG
ncbi:MAG: hypothetical protein WDM78_13340 [Puia sp.]